MIFNIDENNNDFIILYVIRFVGRLFYDRMNVIYVIDYCLFFLVLLFGDLEKKKKKKKKIKEELDSDWWCYNDIMWLIILLCVYFVVL